MKRFLFLAIILSVFGVGCQKEEAPVEPPPASINGTWELRSSQSGKTPAVNFSAGNENKWQFSDGGYLRKEPTKPAVYGTYQTVIDNTVAESVGLLVPAGRFASRIVFDKDEQTKMFYQISNDTLYTLQGFFPADGGSSKIYVRIK